MVKNLERRPKYPSQLSRYVSMLLLALTQPVYSDFSLPSSPDYENNTRIRTVDGATCEARTAQSALQFGVYDAGNTIALNSDSNSSDTKDKDQGVYAQISIPLDLGGGRKPDCQRFQRVMEENAELDLQLKRLEVKLKMAQLKRMETVKQSNTFSE